MGGGDWPCSRSRTGRAIIANAYKSIFEIIEPCEEYRPMGQEMSFAHDVV